MVSTSFKMMAVIAVLAAPFSQEARARDHVSVTIPMRSKLSPVQRLNREGVEAVKKRQYEKAETLFYKAYLYDPADPFTLNNLGFVSEMQGQLDRAHKFYQLASKQSCNAEIDLSSAKGLEKKPMRAALEGLQDLPMRVNRMNVDAMRLLSENRAFEAVTLLEQAVALDPQNPFTRNNLGVAEEAIGDYQSALKNYNTVSASHSSEPVVVTLDTSWSGKPVSKMAEASAMRLQKRIQEGGSGETEAAMLNLRGVFAANQNDWSRARQDFLRAYSLNPTNAFSLNNRAYVAEQDGDLETAQFFYEKARRAGDSSDRVGLATERSAEGKMLFSVAGTSDLRVDTALDLYSRERHRQTGPIELTPRGNGSAGSTTTTPEQRSAPNTPSDSPLTTPQSPR
jgi:Flp pilus assembly protein TadD